MVAIWGDRKVTRLNRVSTPSYCSKFTLRELAAVVLADTTNFPKGLDTPMSVGDCEGNFCTNILSVTLGGDKSDHLCITCDPHGGME